MQYPLRGCVQHPSRGCTAPLEGPHRALLDGMCTAPSQDSVHTLRGVHASPLKVALHSTLRVAVQSSLRWEVHRDLGGIHGLAFSVNTSTSGR